MAAAYAQGIPRSVFLGRVVADGEPLWLPEDTDAAIAYAQWLDEKCSGCGQPTAESTDPANQFSYTAEPVRCHACRQAGQMLEGWDGSRHGLYVTVTREDG